MFTVVRHVQGCTFVFLHRITDAYNNARDRVRYLEILSPHLEALQASPPPTPSTVVSSTLPALASAFRQMDGLSRVYARSGYLEVILTKVYLIGEHLATRRKLGHSGGGVSLWDEQSECALSNLVVHGVSLGGI